MLEWIDLSVKIENIITCTRAYRDNCTLEPALVLQIRHGYQHRALPFRMPSIIMRLLPVHSKLQHCLCGGASEDGFQLCQ